VIFVYKYVKAIKVKSGKIYIFFIVDMHNCKKIESNLFWGAKPATSCYWYNA